MQSPLSLSYSRSALFAAVLVFSGFVLALFFLNYARAQKKDEPKQIMSTFDKPVDATAKTATDADLRKKLTPEQYYVTKQNGTEPPFRNEYWDNHQTGIYVDVISGEPLFSSLDKFESGTGWPSFIRPLPGDHVVKTSARSVDQFGSEVRSNQSDAHLGHVFNDGPAPTHLRYCINSAALRFVPADKLQEQGYGQYISLFAKEK
jgi:methionine-R-sulfoxide reductase